jgi:hypothetical protein
MHKGPAGAHRDRLGILPAGEHVALSGYSLTIRFFDWLVVGDVYIASVNSAAILCHLL